LQGLVHHSHVAEDLRLGREDEDDMKLKSIEYFAPPGEDVWVKVIDVAKDDRGSWRVSCSMKVVDQSSGADLDPDNVVAARHGGGRGGGAMQRSEAAPELWSIHQGTVQSVRPFGVFVELDGFRKYALVHFSQLSDHLTFAPNESDAERMEAIQEIVAPGKGEREGFGCHGLT
jgi:predicted RNA-binding protein with RPS1 domain